MKVYVMAGLLAGLTAASTAGADEAQRPGKWELAVALYQEGDFNMNEPAAGAVPIHSVLVERGWDCGLVQKVSSRQYAGTVRCTSADEIKIAFVSCDDEHLKDVQTVELYGKFRKVVLTSIQLACHLPEPCLAGDPLCDDN